ncbi:right-handed parallel beta-helix repeat-containing protein [Polyangium spumosum]|nr:right-handed parallel beta-helix repeat-containing protein [Polyangium spumosum]
MKCNRDVLVVSCAVGVGAAAGLVPAQAHSSGAIFVQPGQSIQAAIDQASPGDTILIMPGVYQVCADSTNGLVIDKSGISLVGLSTPTERVVVEKCDTQRNGIVVVPSEHKDCMGCHESMAPPFALKPGIDDITGCAEPALHDVEIRGITVRNFENNGLFTECVDGFRIVDVHAEGNPNYGIFPTLSRNGLIARSFATGAVDSGIWVETSENVRVTHNLVEGNTLGLEVSNSDDVELTYNVVRNNSIGIAAFLLPEIYDIRPGAKRIDVRHNLVYDNNKPNTVPENHPLRPFPSGQGILYIGVDASEISGNLVVGNDFTGIVLADFDVVAPGEPSCGDVCGAFQEDQDARDNHVFSNLATGNGLHPGSPGENPFFFVASDLALLSPSPTTTNCFEKNVFDTFFWLPFGPTAPPDCD